MKTSTVKIIIKIIYLVMCSVKSRYEFIFVKLIKKTIIAISISRFILNIYYFCFIFVMMVTIMTMIMIMAGGTYSFSGVTVS